MTGRPYAAQASGTPTPESAVRLLLAALALAALARPLGAQQGPTLERGSRVRVTVFDDSTRRTRQAIGVLERLDRDTAYVRVGGRSAEPFALAEGDYLELAVTVGTNARSGAMVGALAGAIGGGLIGMATYQACQPQPGTPGCEFRWGEGKRIVIGAVAGGGVGALAGYLVGRTMHRRVWMPVNTQGVQVTLGPGVAQLHIAF